MKISSAISIGSVLAHGVEGIRAAVGQALDQIEARDHADQPFVLDHRQGLDAVIHQQTRGHGDMVFGCHGEDFPRHDLRGRAALGLVRLRRTPAKHGAVEVLLPDRFARLQPLVGRTMHQVALGHEAEQVSPGIGHRNAVDAVLDQDAGDLRHGRLRCDPDRVRGHQVTDFHAVFLSQDLWVDRR